MLDDGAPNFQHESRLNYSYNVDRDSLKQYMQSGAQKRKSDLDFLDLTLPKKAKYLLCKENPNAPIRLDARHSDIAERPSSKSITQHNHMARPLAVLTQAKKSSLQHESQPAYSSSLVRRNRESCLVDFRAEESPRTSTGERPNQTLNQFRFDELSAKSRDQSPIKTVSRLSDFEASVHVGPCLFIPASYVPPSKDIVPYLKRIVQSFKPEDVLCDTRGYYISFKNSPSGKLFAQMCYSNLNGTLFIHRYQLVMEQYDGYERKEEGETDTVRGSLGSNSKARLPSDVQQDGQVDTESRKGKQLLQGSRLRNAFSLNPAIHNSDVLNNKQDRTYINREAPRYSSPNLPQSPKIPLQSSDCDLRCGSSDQEQNTVISHSEVVNVLNDHIRTSLPPCDKQSHAFQRTTPSIDERTEWISGSNEPPHDFYSLRLARLIHSEGSTPFSDGASTQSGTLSSRALSEMSTPRCNKCQSSHSPDYHPLVKCPSCQRHFHGRCHKPPIPTDCALRKSWQCSHCVKRNRPLPPPLSAILGAPNAFDDLNSQPGNPTLLEMKAERFRNSSSQLSNTMATDLGRALSKSPEPCVKDVVATGSLSNRERNFPVVKASRSQENLEINKSTGPSKASEAQEQDETDPDYVSEAQAQDASTHASSVNEIATRASNGSTERDRSADAISNAGIPAHPRVPSITESRPEEIAATNISKNCEGTVGTERNRDVDFVYDDGTRPPFTYDSLVGMALCTAPEHTLTAAQVVEWVSQHFSYYKIEDNDNKWKNSIAVHLSKGPSFHKQGLADNGKGCLWRLDEGKMKQYCNSLGKAQQGAKPSTKLEKARLQPGEIHGDLEEDDYDPTHHFEILDNGYSRYKIVRKSPSGKEWEDLLSLESVQIKNFECHVGDLVELPCVTWHKKQNPRALQPVSIGQVLSVKMHEGHSLLHVLWYYQRTELKTIQCANYRQWPPHCEWMKSTHVDIIAGNDLTGLANASTIQSKTGNLVLDFGVGSGKGSLVRSSNHRSVSWLDYVSARPLCNDDHEGLQQRKSKIIKLTAPKSALAQLSTASSTRSKSVASNGSDQYHIRISSSSDADEESMTEDPITEDDLWEPSTPIESIELETGSTQNDRYNLPKYDRHYGHSALDIGTLETSVMRTHQIESVSKSKGPENYILNSEVTDTAIEDALWSQVNNRQFFAKDEYKPVPRDDLASRISQPLSKASGRYFKKHKPGRDDSSRLWPVDNLASRPAKASSATSASIVEPSIEAVQVIGTKRLYDFLDDSMGEPMTLQTCEYNSMEELLGVRDEDDYELILHEGELAFREKATV